MFLMMYSQWHFGTHAQWSTTLLVVLPELKLALCVCVCSVHTFGDEHLSLCLYGATLILFAFLNNSSPYILRQGHFIGHGTHYLKTSAWIHRSGYPCFCSGCFQVFSVFNLGLGISTYIFICAWQALSSLNNLPRASLIFFITPLFVCEFYEMNVIWL